MGKKKKKALRNAKKRQSFVTYLVITVLCIMLIAIAYVMAQLDIVREIFTKKELLIEQTTEVSETESETEPSEVPETETDFEAAEGIPMPVLKEEEIYTFMQGPKAYESKTPWSGSWCNMELADSLFSIFGCGLCDLASIYGTLTPYDCSPIDMYYFAIESTDYSPGGGYGAIDWPYMKKVLEKVGITSKLRRKNTTYEQFCAEMEHCIGAIVLVSSYNDDTYWPDTEGHYVNIWSYNSESEMVFLGDSGDPTHNRKWIPLRYVYDALKTSGSYQYMIITQYDESKNTWKHNGITEQWTVPKYYKPKG